MLAEGRATADRLAAAPIAAGHVAHHRNMEAVTVSMAAAK
jgi:hypothetical protein